MSKCIALWRAGDGSRFVELKKDGDRYLLDASPGVYTGNLPSFLTDADAIWHVDILVRRGEYDPPPLTWSKVE
jgi:hypothetical protein